MKKTTQRQGEVLTFITEYIKAHAYPPTIREIADFFSISVKGAYDHVTALKKKGCLKPGDKRSRTIELVKAPEEKNSRVLVEIPILGSVAAGKPILSEENREGTLPLDQSMLKSNRQYFAMKVRGDSMEGAGIMDGDTAVIEKQDTVRNGEIGMAVIDDAAALKRIFKESTRFRLESENPKYTPIYSRDVRIVGRLAHVLRSY